MDITTLVTGAITAWLGALETAILGPALAAATELLFRTPDLTHVAAVRDASELTRYVADTLFALAVLVAGVFVMTQGGTDARYTVKTVAPRLVLAAVLSNVSLVLASAFIALNNAVVDAVLAPSPQATIAAALASLTAAGPIGADLLGLVIGLVAAILALLLVALAIGRLFILLLALAAAPLALATYALPQTSELARLWWRIFGGLLFVQVVEAVLVHVAAGVIASGDWLGGPVPGLVSGLVVVTLLYALVRLPFTAYAWAFHARLERSVVVRTLLVGARAVRGGV